MRPSARSLSIALASVFAVSFYGYAQLGGPDGIRIPYAGRLDGANSLANFPFSVIAVGPR